MLEIVTTPEIYKHYKIKKALPLILGVLCTTTVFAQNSSRSYALTELLSMLDKAASVSEYIRLSAQFETIADYDPSQWLPFYYTAYCNIKLGFLLKGDVDKNKIYSQAAQTNIKKAEELCPVNYPAGLAEIYNVYSMAYRVLIAARPMINGRKFGSRANGYLDKALKLSPHNPRSLYLSGQVKYLTPALFGGDKIKAKQLLTLALENFNDQQGSPIMPHWGKKECEILLSKIR